MPTEPPKNRVQYLEYLRNVVGLTPREIALATDLNDLRSLVVLLADTLPGEQTGNWLRARNRLLERERPLDLLCTTQFDGYDEQYKRVKRAAMMYVDGDPI